jgi:hypothetical protein
MVYDVNKATFALKKLMEKKLDHEVTELKKLINKVKINI